MVPGAERKVEARKNSAGGQSMRTALVAATSVWLSLCCWGKTVHVDNRTGSDENDGASAETPLATIREAVRRLAPGDVLTLANTGAPYRESIGLHGRAGKPGAPLVIEGNGAAISGLKPIPRDQWQEKEGGVFFFPAKSGGARRPYLVEDGQPTPAAKSLAELQPGQSFWAPEGVHFMPGPARTMDDHRLEGTLLSAGVAIANASCIVVRNLVCEYFSNDGVNVHGNCRGLLFENIECRWNGDDGFSVHEDVGAVVYGGHFHHNNFGIQDVNAARSVFHGVVVEDNRLVGVDFYGGFHSLVDAVVRNNAQGQVRVGPGSARHLGFADANPACMGLTYFKNVSICGGPVGLHVRKGARASVANCLVLGGATGVVVEEGAACHILKSVIADCAERELACSSAEAHFDCNVYWPGRLSWAGSLYGPGAWADYRNASGQDAHSTLQRPEFAAAGSFLVAAPQLLFNDREVTPGPTHAPDFAFPGTPLVNKAAKAEPVRLRHQYDFETVNPWSRVYPAPAKNKGGEPVQGTSELSDEQAHSGKRSARLSATFPAPPPGNWCVKLFSTRFAYRRPVRSIAFWLFGDGSGRRFRPRIRDRDAECFYGKAQTVDWTGWQQVRWDLDEAPPENVQGGNENGLQDCPPLEIILDVYTSSTAAGDGFSLYIDDLDVELLDDQEQTQEQGP